MDQIPLFHSSLPELPLLGRGKVRDIDSSSGIIMRVIGIPTG